MENVLAYARLEEGRSPGKPVATTLGALLAGAAPNLKERVEASGMELDIASESPEQTPLTVEVEAVGQILFNLVDNACKYCAEAGDRRVHLSARVNDGALEIRVRDHGPGVPREQTDAIFEPFDRGTRSQGDATPGVGLGLALARGLARDMGGELRLKPQPDGGACFELTLPKR